MLKKLLAAALVASLLILPVNSVAPVNPVNAGAASYPEQGYRPGNVPAQTDAAESMSPALHALVLAMLNHDVDRFAFEDAALTWEVLYNMLSLYGQLDSRSVTGQGEMLLPEETVLDYAAALDRGLTTPSGLLGTPPANLRDRLDYDRASGCYTVVCGEDGLSQIQVDSVKTFAEGCTITGALVYQVNGQALARFQADLTLRDNMFGYAVTGVRLTV